MTAHAQAVLIQAVAFVFVLGTVPDGGRMRNGLIAGCLLFWITYYLLQLCHLTRFEQFFLRWGSVPFVLLGVLVLAPMVESFLQSTVYPTMRQPS